MQKLRRDSDLPTTLKYCVHLDLDAARQAVSFGTQGRMILTLFKDYLTELNELVLQGISAGKNLSVLQGELVPTRFRSLRNQDFGQTLQRNRENLLGLPAGQPLEPVVSYGGEQVYLYYSKKY